MAKIIKNDSIVFKATQRQAMKRTANIDYLQIRPNMLNGVLQFPKPCAGGSSPPGGVMKTSAMAGVFVFWGSAKS